MARPELSASYRPLCCSFHALKCEHVHDMSCQRLTQAQVMKYNPNIFSMSVDFATGADTPKKELVTRSLQFLLVLISYETPDLLYVNEFRKSLSKLHRPADLQFVHQGIKQILDRPVRSNRSRARGSDLLMLYLGLRQPQLRHWYGQGAYMGSRDDRLPVGVHGV